MKLLRTLTLFFITILIITSQTCPDDPLASWVRVFITEGVQRAYGIIEVGGSDLLVVGYADYEDTQKDALIMRLTYDGELLSAKAFDSQGRKDVAFGALKLEAGRVLVYGESHGQPNQSMFMVLDDRDRPICTNYFGGSSDRPYNTFQKAIGHTDGSVLLAGIYEDQAAVLKVDPESCQLITKRTYTSSSQYMESHTIYDIQAAGSDYILVGTHSIYGQPSKAWVALIDSSLQTVWMYEHTASKYTGINGVKVFPEAENPYLLIGYYNYPSDILYETLTVTGQPSSPPITQDFSGADDSLESITSNSERTIAVGYTKNPSETGSPTADVLVIESDNNGLAQTVKMFHWQPYEAATDVAPLSNGCFALSGWIAQDPNYSTQEPDILVMKIDSNLEIHQEIVYTAFEPERLQFP